MHRPDLASAPTEVREYVEWLEAELARLRADEKTEPEAPLEPDEPPTTLNIITLTASGLAKRTPRHLYSRQRRGGMGVFDIESADDDPPVALVQAEERGHILVITGHARAYRLPVYFLNESPLRAKPGPYMNSLPAPQSGERESGTVIPTLPVAGDDAWRLVLPALSNPTGYFAVVSERGFVRALPAHLFGETMREGLLLFKPEEEGAPAAACWCPLDGGIFLATRLGMGVRFPARTIPSNGAPGIRLENGDAVVAACGVRDDSGVFRLGVDGKGTIRAMSGFNANKAPGAGGKIAMKTDELVGAVTVGTDADIFILSHLSKLIRFKAA
ncbi:MAG: DNA gyrase C-terminal beta-propeller domain-containing protein, partial [Anaerolineales bacterium]